MPYHIDDNNCVCGEDGKPVPGGCHDTPAEAKKHLAALEANVPDAKTQEAVRSRTGYFAELADLTEAELSEDGAVARVTLIKPGWSANGRYYSKTVLKAARPLFEGGQAYADHPGKSERKDRPERSIRDLVGYYDNTKQEKDGRITGDFHIVQEWLRPIVKASVTANSNLAGLSINALGETRMGEMDGKRGIIVEAIVKHNSTDVVTAPAAGGKFESLLMSDGDSFTRDLIEAMPLDELTQTLREARPDLFEVLKKEWKTPRDDKAVSAARAEVTELKKKLADAEKKHRASIQALKEAESQLAQLGRLVLVDRLLSESKLPKEWRDDIRAQLLEAKDETAMLGVLEREAAKAGKRPRPLAVKGGGLSIAPPGGTPLMRAAPIAHALGVDSRLAGAKTYEEFVEAKTKLMKGI